MGVTDLLLLSCLGFAITAHAQDCAVPARVPNMHLKDEYSVKENFTDGDRAVFECAGGYTSAGGSPSITCTAGNWSTVMLKCARKKCGSPGEVEHGEINSPKESLFGDHIEIACNQGYRLVGKSTLTCGANGWQGRMPICEVLTCDEAPQVEGATSTPYKDPYDYGDVVQYSCQNGLTLHGSASISCSDDGTFKPDPPTCISICGKPHVENGYVDDDRPSYKHNDEITFKCSWFYYIDGNPTLTCQADGNWSSAPPECTLSVGKTAGVGTGAAAVAAAAAAAIVYGVLQWPQQGREKRFAEDIATEAEEEVALLDAVGLKQSPTVNGQVSGEGHRGQVPRKRVNPFRPKKATR